MNREILFRGQHRRKGEKVKLDGTPVESKWVYGGICQFNEDRSIIYQTKPEFKKYPVYTDTIGRCTGLKDKNGVKIFEGDIVKLFVFRGQIIQMCGAFGVSVESAIDWDYLASEINPVTGCDNSSNFCQNDNFVSLWELMWNYNQEENMCGVIEVIGNIHDNPELMGGN